MLGSRSTSVLKMLPVARLGKSGYDCPFYTFQRAASSSGGPGFGNEGPKQNNKKRTIYTAGVIAAIAGMAYGYKVYHDEKAKCDGKGGCEEDKCDSQCLHKMDKEEELIAKANNDLEKALKDVKPKAMEATESALKAYCEAVVAIKIFMEKAYCAIEDENLDSPRFEEIWCAVYEAAVKRCANVKDALQKGQCAWELLCKLREIIENGKNCKYTSCNPLLITAEETLVCAERELLNAKAKMDCVQSESRLVEQF